MSHTYKAAIIGLSAIAAQRPDGPDYPSAYGRVSESHASVYYDHPRVELVAVCDIRPQAHELFRQSWQNLLPQTRYYTDYRQLLEELQPDLVSVVTPDHLHADIVVDAATKGAKAIFCEKPLATTLTDADRMLAACTANGTVLAVNHTRRWSPIFQQARQILRSGELGNLRTLRVDFFSQRAMLFRNGGHMVDMLNFLADADPAWVWAELEDGFDHFDIYRGDGGHDPNLEPSACGYIHYANGVRAFYESGKTPSPVAQFTLICDKGRLEVTDRQITITRLDGGGKWTSENLPLHSEREQMLHTALDELIACVEHGGKPTSSGESARKTVDVLLAMLQSHVRGNVRIELITQSPVLRRTLR